MRIVDSRGVVHLVFSTASLIAELTRHHENFECRHESAESPLRRRVVSGGGVQIVKQCARCGACVGGAVKWSAECAELPLFDKSIAERFEADKCRAHRALMLRHLALQQEGEAEHQKEYTAYLSSPEWGTKRARVLERANGVCEGCGERPAVEVHHITYDHIFDELLFELAAVCRPCHERLHGKDGEGLPRGPGVGID